MPIALPAFVSDRYAGSICEHDRAVLDHIGPFYYGAVVQTAGAAYLREDGSNLRFVGHVSSNI
jgi:hypothetical protein